MEKKNHRNPSGMGSIRLKNSVKNGKTYTSWEGRITVGFNPLTGKQKVRYVYGQTQKEVREKMQALQVQLNNKTYIEPSKMTVEQWFNRWEEDYLVSIKPRTADSYKSIIKNYLLPSLGKVKLQSLQTAQIQCLYSKLSKDGLSPKTIRNVHGVLHAALEQAVELNYIHSNPSNPCKLPHVEKREIKPMDDSAIVAFMKAIQGHKFEDVYLVTLFTGLREGEVLGLTWDCVDFKRGIIVVKQQLQRKRDGTGEYDLVSTKTRKNRTLTVAPSVMDILKKVKEQQETWQRLTEGAWENEMNLVFTNELGHHLSAHTVYLNYKRVVKRIGHERLRFHDLRHTYAVNSLRAGDDIKTVQENLGHYSAAFTLDTYAHATMQMKAESANRMERFIGNLIPQMALDTTA